ncbi:MAG: AAA family ATPase [Chloroflexota bacterium]
MSIEGHNSEHQAFQENGLETRLLGPPQILWKGEIINLRRAQVRALLYRLAAYKGAVSRDHLSDLFWPETREITARRNLSHLLSHLRRALPDAGLVSVTEDSVELHCTRDTILAEHYINLARDNNDLEVLQKAHTLFRGDFLAGFSLPSNLAFESWMLQESSKWERSRLQVLSSLIELLISHNQLQSALECAHEYLTIDELAEHIHRRLIVIYTAMGDRSAALRQYQICADVLDRELGVAPLPETQIMYQRAKAGRNGLHVPQFRVRRRDHVQTESPLIGRQESIHDLFRLLRNAVDHRGALVLVTGEAGIGKSRLVHEFTTQAVQPAPTDVSVAIPPATVLSNQSTFLFGYGSPSTVHVPYEPLTRAVRSWLGSHADVVHDTLKLAPEYWLSEATRLWPELVDHVPGLASFPAGQPDDAQSRLFHAIMALLDAIASSTPVLALVFDDLQWSDESTKAWLTYALDHLDRRNLLLIAVDREGNLLEKVPSHMRRSDSFASINLTGLDTESIQTIIRHAAPSLPQRGKLAEQLSQATGGNPFMLLETVRLMMEVPTQAEIDSIPLARSVREAVNSRLALLSMGAKQTLQGAAVLGEEFGFHQVRLTSGRSEWETEDQLEELISRQLAIEHQGNYRFAHGLTREAVIADLTPVRERILHRRAAAALEALEPNAVEALAIHYDKAGKYLEALEYLRKAEERATNLFAWTEAEKHQQRSLELYDLLDPRYERREWNQIRTKILTARAHTRYLQGHRQDRDDDLRVLEDIADQTGSRAIALTSILHRVRYLVLDAEYDRAIESCHKGLELAEQENDLEASARLIAQQGFAHYFLGQPRLALQVLEKVIDAKEVETDPALCGRVMHVAGYVHFHLGDYEESLRCQEQALDCHKQVGDLNRVAWDLTDIGAVLTEMLRFDDADARIAEGLALAKRIGAQPAEAYAMATHGVSLLHQGDYTGAAACFGSAHALQYKLDVPHGMVAANEGMALACFHLGDLQGAQEHLSEGIKIARSIEHSRRLNELLVIKGLVDISDGNMESAHNTLDEALALARTGECLECEGMAQATLSRACWLGNDHTQAQEHARQAIEVGQAPSLRTAGLWGQIGLGLAQISLGELDKGIESVEQAITLLPQVHEGWIGTELAHLAYAWAAEKAGEVELVEKHKALAQAVVDEKAERIPDDRVRERYLQNWHRLPPLNQVL